MQRTKSISKGKISWDTSIESPLTTYIPDDFFHQPRFGQYLTVNDIVCLVHVQGQKIKDRIAELSVLFEL